MTAHFVIDGYELCVEADEIEQTGDFLLARKNGRNVAGVRLDDCVAFWIEEGEKRHGHWAYPGLCSICGENKYKDIDIWADWNPPFCPNCGSPMDGVTDDEK